MNEDLKPLFAALVAETPDSLLIEAADLDEASVTWILKNVAAIRYVFEHELARSEPNGERFSEWLTLRWLEGFSGDELRSLFDDVVPARNPRPITYLQRFTTPLARFGHPMISELPVLPLPEDLEAGDSLAAERETWILNAFDELGQYRRRQADMEINLGLGEQLRNGWRADRFSEYLESLFPNFEFDD